jgi:hypothetical protein
MKKLTLFIISIAMASIASAVTVTADAAYKTKVFDNGVVAFENAVVAGAELEAAGFVVGVNTFNPVEAKDTLATVGKTQVVQTASSGLFKRVDTSVGYRFAAPLAKLTLGATYKSFSKTAQTNGNASNTELFARLNGDVKGTLLTWNATALVDSKNHTNNVEANVSLPFGFKWLKIAPAVGLGFNDPGAATIAAFKSAKRYALVGVGVGYYSKNAKIAAEYYQRRNTFTGPGGVIDGVSFGVSYKL